MIVSGVSRSWLSGVMDRIFRRFDSILIEYPSHPMDLYEFASRSKYKNGSDDEEAPRKTKKAKSKPMSLAQLHQSIGVVAASKPIDALAPPTVDDHIARRQKLSHTKTINAVASSAPLKGVTSINSTSISLAMHYLDLRSFLHCGRACKAFHVAAQSRMAWAGSLARVYIAGSREERRRKGGEPELTEKNFDPTKMHNTTDGKEHQRTEVHVGQSSLVPEASAAELHRSVHPLEFCALSCPMLRNLRHLVYPFAAPAVRTKLASLWREDMFVTEAVTAEFPLAHLPVGAFPFLSSLSLRNITLCSQISIQSAFHRFGVQSHSFLRALELHASTVLNEEEKNETISSVLTEVGAQLVNLEILCMNQRNLPHMISISPLLNLTKLHTLVFDASFSKTPERLEIVRALALHSNLQYLEWPGWTSMAMKHLFGGVRQTLEAEEAHESLLRASELSREEDVGESASDDHRAAYSVAPETEEEILGLDADETSLAPSKAIPSAADLNASAVFQFRSWTVDHLVSPINMQQYFGLGESNIYPLLPHLHTLQFLSPMKFASITPVLPVLLPNLPALMALRIHVSHFSLGKGFWRYVSAVPLPSLRRLEVDQVSLVVLNQSRSVRGSTFEINPMDVDDLPPENLWSSFPGLKELTLADMTLPHMSGLASSCPLLQSVRIEHCSFSPHEASGYGCSVKEFMQEISSLQHLHSLTLVHCPDLDLSPSGSLEWVSRSLLLERVHFCARQFDSLHRDPHESGNIDWLPTTVKFFRGTDQVTGTDGSAGGDTIPTPSQHNRLTKQHSVSREHIAFASLHQSVHSFRRQHFRSSPPEKRFHATGVSFTYWDTETGAKRTMHAEGVV